VAGIYNRASYLTEKRQALEVWGAHVAALVAGRAGNIVPLMREQRAAADWQGENQLA
jgi:hypothetical protein